MATLAEYEQEYQRIVESSASAEQRAESLSYLSLEIRRIAWSWHISRAARNLARRADEDAARLVGGAVNPLPRFGEITSGGVLYKARR